jgi:hypothetical protein
MPICREYACTVHMDALRRQIADLAIDAPSYNHAGNELQATLDNSTQ